LDMPKNVQKKKLTELLPEKFFHQDFCNYVVFGTIFFV
jgi:hypothetical protein